MDKNAIKKYAVWARRELISRVSQRAALYEITPEGYGDQNASSVHGRLMSAEEKKQRSALIAQIKEKGYEQVMEEIAYTWFNRFSALRFMEVNGYLPTRIRVFTNDDNAFKPQILDEAIDMEMDGLDLQRIYNLKNANDDEALFKYMIITQCNALSSILPGMFQRISDYTELLFPDNLLRKGSIVEQMIAMIPQEDWTDQVQIIGWLYEGYNTERNEMVYDGNMSKSRVTKDLLPAATTIFTPDWPIRYMVENSLGRLWLEGHPNDDLKAGWKYYLDEAEQEPEVQAQLIEIRKKYAVLKPEDLLVIDPCQGSGHILAYMFDVLVQIYEAYGYSAREAVSNIVEHNIWGLDIDERAAQLAYFSVMMKARQYDRRFFSRGIQPHVYAIQESNYLDPHCIEYFVDDRKELKSAMNTLVKELHDAKEYGSILRISQVDFDVIYARFEEIQNENAPSIYTYQVLEELLPFVKMAEVLAKEYHIVVTNPPYLGRSRFSPKLDKYIKEYYPDEKSDLSMVMFKRSLSGFVKDNGFTAFITTSSWMFLTSFEKIRSYTLNTNSLTSIVDFGTELFEGKVGHNPIVSWVCRSSKIDYMLNAVRLVKFCYSRRDEKEPEFFNKENWYYALQSDFLKIPGCPIAYWLSTQSLDLFSSGELLSNKADLRQGLITGDNERFIRFWMECSTKKITTDIRNQQKWFFYHKGGDYRKWYGNIILVVNWEKDGQEIINFRDSKGKQRSRPQNVRYYLKEGFTWTALTMADFNVRYMPSGGIFDAKGSSGFVKDSTELLYIIGLCNSKVSMVYMSFLAPTMDYSAGSVGKLPIIIDKSRISEINAYVSRCIELSKADWDSFEVSWEFKKNPLIQRTSFIAEAFRNWEKECLNRFDELKRNEEYLNSVYIEIYGMGKELTPEIHDSAVSVRKADLQRDIKAFISYAVGCMFGRYSLDSPGLIYAGGTWDDKRYRSFVPDKDAIIPICDDEYFEDDIVGLLIKFIESVYGKEHLEENLSFIANALGGKGTSREIIRNYFINEFYKDHCSTYSVIASGKRPIYWMFDSGKKNGFKCLIYMHRYQPDTIARIRTDYVHEQQSRYRTAISDIENRIANEGTGERVRLSKQLEKLHEQAEELRVYEEKIHHLADQMIRIDLDDGVKVNYAKFQDVLAKIK